MGLEVFDDLQLGIGPFAGPDLIDPRILRHARGVLGRVARQHRGAQPKIAQGRDGRLGRGHQRFTRGQNLFDFTHAQHHGCIIWRAAAQINRVVHPYRTHAVARLFGDVTEWGWGHILHLGQDTATERVIRGLGQGAQNRSRLCIKGCRDLQATGGQRAGFVKDDHVDIRHAFERGFRGQKQPPAVKLRRGRDGHGRHGEAHSAGAGDYERGNGHIDRHAQIARRNEPAREGRSRHDMDDGRVRSGGLVGEGSIRPARGFCRRHKLCDAAQRGVFAHGCCV